MKRPWTPAEWDAYSDGVEDGIQRGYALAMAEVLADLRQASHALVEEGWIPAVIARVDVDRARCRPGSSFIPRNAA